MLCHWQVIKWVESTEDVILTDENGSTRRKPCTIATLSFTNRTWTDRGMNPSLCSDMSRLTAWTMARPCGQMACSVFFKRVCLTGSRDSNFCEVTVASYQHHRLNQNGHASNRMKLISISSSICTNFSLNMRIVYFIWYVVDRAS